MKFNQTVANAESVPENTSAHNALDASEREYNRMISQHTTYHRMMMDDLMKLSTESGAAANPSFDPMSVVSGLGTTVETLDASNQQLLQSAAKHAEQGKQRAITASNLNAYITETGLKLQNDMKAYDAIVSNAPQREGFVTMDAALEMSKTVNESQKYALFIFGAVAVFLLYKTVKHL